MAAVRISGCYERDGSETLRVVDSSNDVIEAQWRDDSSVERSAEEQEEEEEEEDDEESPGQQERQQRRRALRSRRGELVGSAAAAGPEGAGARARGGGRSGGASAAGSSTSWGQANGGGGRPSGRGRKRDRAGGGGGGSSGEGSGSDWKGSGGSSGSGGESAADDEDGSDQESWEPGRRGCGGRGQARPRRGRGGRRAASSIHMQDGQGLDSAVQAGSDGDSDSEVQWVQCDSCQKWRRLAPGAAPPPASAPWHCWLDPRPAVAAAGCGAPQEADDAAAAGVAYRSCPGFVLPGEEPCSAANVAHFSALLAASPALRDGWRCEWGEGLVVWLAGLAPGALLAGAAVPRELAKLLPPEYAAVLTQMSLELVPPPKGRHGRQQQQQQRRVGGGGGAGAAAARHAWRQPAYLSGLVFDGAALAEAARRGAEASRRMYLSGATLVVVPGTLIPHWRQQILQHVKQGLLRVAILDSSTEGGGTSYEPYELAWNHDVVITTFTRLSAEWTAARSGLGKRHLLLQVHWLRIILDEGHTLGSPNITNKLSMACELVAERRWVMTGTPTPATAHGSGAAHLQPLLAFLRERPYGTSRDAWLAGVQRPLEARTPWGRRQLMDLLRRVMIRRAARASKADLVTLPPCHRQVCAAAAEPALVVLLHFGPEHAASYNELVEVIRRNLLLADWCDDEHRESLLSSRQAKWAKEMLRNVRLSCCVAGALNLVVKDDDVLETLQLLAGRLEMPRPRGTLPGGLPWTGERHPQRGAGLPQPSGGREGDGDDEGDGGDGAGDGRRGRDERDGTVSGDEEEQQQQQEQEGPRERQQEGAEAAPWLASNSNSPETKSQKQSGGGGAPAGAPWVDCEVRGGEVFYVPATHPLSGIENALRYGT
ncbi:F-box protein, partial [Monoraphidium neglectum]